MKILIIGPVASGKTSLAKEISKKYHVKYDSIDDIVYDENNQKRSIESQNNIVKNILKNNDWIIEGILREHLKYLYRDAEQIIYVDTPLKVRKRRIIRRYIKQKLGIEKCSYPPTWKMMKQMLQWTMNDEKNKEKMMMELKEYPEKVIIKKRG